MQKIRNYDIFDKYKLKASEIEKAKQDGLLSENIETLLTYKKNDGYYHKRTLSQGYFQSLGIKTFYVPSRKYSGFQIGSETFYITDFYLICCEGHRDWRFLRLGSNNQEEVYDNPDKLKIIPLNKVEYIKVEFGRNASGYVPPTTKQVQKSPAKGAVVGAILGGTTGAVIGASMNTGTKTKTILPGGAYNTDYYNLRIKLVKEEKEFLMEEFFENDGTTNKNIHDKQNEAASLLIKQAHKRLSLEDKKKIVNETISNGKENFTKEKTSNAIGMVIVIAIMFAIVLAIEKFC